MQKPDSAGTEELLAEISRLEDQIAKLSSQLEANHAIISRITQSLHERDDRINKLETSIVFYSQFLLQQMLDKVHQCKNQVRQEIDDKAIKPVITEIQQKIQLLESLINESMAFVQTSKALIFQSIETAANMAQKAPDQARFFIEKSIVDPALAHVHRNIETLNRFLVKTRHLATQTIILPATSAYNQSLEAILTLPSQSQLFFQVRLLEPTLQFINKLTESGYKLSDDTFNQLNNLLKKLVNSINEGLAGIAEQVKKSPFWDGKNNMTPVAP